MKRIRRILTFIAFALWLIALIMWPLSHRLSSIGFEREDRYGDKIVNRWYGIVYPGNGGVIAGAEATFEPDRGQAIDAFDFAGAFLEPALEDRAENGWEGAGFVWRMRGHQRWVGVPAWAMAAITGIVPSIIIVKRRRRASKEAVNVVD